MWLEDILASVSEEDLSRTGAMLAQIREGDEVLGEIPEDIRPLLAAEYKIQADTMKSTNIMDAWILEQLHVLRQVTAVSLKHAGIQLGGEEYFAAGWRVVRPRKRLIVPPTETERSILRLVRYRI